MFWRGFSPLKFLCKLRIHKSIILERRPLIISDRRIKSLIREIKIIPFHTPVIDADKLCFGIIFSTAQRQCVRTAANV